MLSLFLDLIDEESDRELFEKIYDNYQKQMFYVIYKKIQDRQYAEDALQNLFIRIATNITKLRTLNEEETQYYLYTCAKNAAIDMNKKLSKIKAVSLEEFYNIPDNSYKYTAKEFEEKDYVVSLLQKLPDKYSDVLYCRYVTGLNDYEISIALNRKINTVRQQMSRGKKQFIALYEKENNK